MLISLLKPLGSGKIWVVIPVPPGQVKARPEILISSPPIAPWLGTVNVAIPVVVLYSIPVILLIPPGSLLGFGSNTWRYEETPTLVLNDLSL